MTDDNQIKSKKVLFFKNKAQSKSLKAVEGGVKDYLIKKHNE